MKYLLFLLLLSAQAMGQQKDSVCTGTIMTYFTNPPSYGLLGYHIAGCRHVEEASRKTQAARAGFEAENRALREENNWPSIGIYSPHIHKWVELHQDTVEYNPYSRGYDAQSQVRYDSSGRMVMYGFRGEYWETEIPLICLICHQEKRKLIHYKQKYPDVIEVRPNESDRKEKIRKLKERAEGSDFPL